MNYPKAILFDMGGVLQDPADAWGPDTFSLSFPNGIPQPELEDWFIAMSKDCFDTFIAMPVPRPPMDVRPFIVRWLVQRHAEPNQAEVDYWFDLMGQWEPRPLYPFVHDALAQLHANGFTLGVVSNTLMPGTHMRANFERGGILRFFRTVVFSSEVGVNKPDPAIFEHALEMINVSAADAWFVGDKPQRDVCGAHRAGMTAILVDGPHEHRISDRPECEPDLRVHNIADLPQVLRAIK